MHTISPFSWLSYVMMQSSFPASACCEGSKSMNLYSNSFIWLVLNAFTEFLQMCVSGFRALKSWFKLHWKSSQEHHWPCFKSSAAHSNSKNCCSIKIRWSWRSCFTNTLPSITSRSFPYQPVNWLLAPVICEPLPTSWPSDILKPPEVCLTARFPLVLGVGFPMLFIELDQTVFGFVLLCEYFSPTYILDLDALFFGPSLLTAFPLLLFKTSISLIDIYYVSISARIASLRTSCKT